MLFYIAKNIDGRTRRKKKTNLCRDIYAIVSKTTGLPKFNGHMTDTVCVGAIKNDIHKEMRTMQS